MNKKNYQDFDISIAGTKRRPRANRPPPSMARSSNVNCEHPSCRLSGDYKAPASPDNLNSVRWFCKRHAAQYNRKWNFFKGRKLAQDTGPAPTEESPVRRQQQWTRLDPLIRRSAPRFSRKEKLALEILALDDSCRFEDVKKRYRSLVKDLHPDQNGGDRSDEDQLNKVIWAWDQLRESRNFRI
ncbi:MAG: J domain-containing protein [Rhodobacteraceae bacterium]|nr:J domain-containing protein [Paracoccaceae bacterium]